MPRGRSVVGRDAEFAAIEEFVACAAQRPAALVMSGEPGIGTTTLWDAAVEQAEAHGHRVLAHRSSEAAAGLAFGALIDLAGPALDEVADALAPPRRRALEVALLLADAEDDASPVRGQSAWRSSTSCESSRAATPWSSRSTTSSGWTRRRRTSCRSRGFTAWTLTASDPVLYLLRPDGSVFSGSGDGAPNSPNGLDAQVGRPGGQPAGNGMSRSHRPATPPRTGSGGATRASSPSTTRS